MNDEFVHRQGRAFAVRLFRENGDNPSACIEKAWLLALDRLPTEEEKRKNLEFLLRLERRWTNDGKNGESLNWLPEQLRTISPARAEALAKLCLTIFNLNEFLYVD
jgi:hypothetical protein